MESFLRNECKYVIPQEKMKRLLERLKQYIEPDTYASSHIMSVYFDNDNFDLMTKSVEKPMFKEKLRIRSYQEPLQDEEVYVELKKKFDGVVYKKRTTAKYQDVMEDTGKHRYSDNLVGKEIVSLANRYGKLKPKIFVSCDRWYFVGKTDKTLRITFDRDLKYRTKDVELKNTDDDLKLDDSTIMEIKVVGAMPLWLSRILDEEKVYKSSYSKAGKAFLNELKNTEPVLEKVETVNLNNLALA